MRCHADATLAAFRRDLLGQGRTVDDGRFLRRDEFSQRYVYELHIDGARHIIHLPGLHPRLVRGGDVDHEARVRPRIGIDGERWTWAGALHRLSGL